MAAISVVNAFQLNEPKSPELAALLLDIGAYSTSINFIHQGIPLITRIIRFGGAQLTEYIGQMSGVQADAAELEKIAISDSTQALARTAIEPLAREIRSSIDFFERQHDCRVGSAFACGGSATSEFLVRIISETVGIELKRWNPSEHLDISRLNGEKPQLEIVGPSLAAAVGVAASRLA